MTISLLERAKKEDASGAKDGFTLMLITIVAVHFVL